MRFFTVFSLFAMLIMGCKAPVSSEPQKTAKVYKAPDFKVTGLKGETISLSANRGKVILLDFWATWCPPCVMSAPEVEKLVDEYKGKNFTVISISLDNGPEPVKHFLEKHDLHTQIALAQDSDVGERYGVEGIPAFFIIDQKGNIANAWEGFAPSMPSLWRKEINRLLSK